MDLVEPPCGWSTGFFAIPLTFIDLKLLPEFDTLLQRIFFHWGRPKAPTLQSANMETVLTSQEGNRIFATLLNQALPKINEKTPLDRL